MAKKKAPPKPMPAPIIGGGQQPGHIGPGIHRNPPPDPRMHGSIPWSKVVARGYIVEHSPAGPGQVYFLYNPFELGYSFSFNADLADPASIAPIPTMGALGGTGLSFSIFFNRQYEVAYNGDKQGVNADIDALKYLVGMKDPSYHYMLLKTLKFIFGPDLIFYGFINSMSARIAQFSENMVPMLAEVSINAIQMPENFDPKTLFSSLSATLTNPSTQALIDAPPTAAAKAPWALGPP